VAFYRTEDMHNSCDVESHYAKVELLVHVN